MTSNHISTRDLSILLIRNWDNASINDIWVSKNNSFELSRGNREALNLDELLETISDVDVAIFVNLSNVTSVEPSIFSEGSASLLNIVEIALHDLRTTDAELALLANTKGLARGYVDNLSLGVGNGGTSTAGLDAVIRVASSKGRELRHSPKLLHISLQAVTNSLLSLRTKWRSCRLENFEARHIVVIDDRVLTELEKNWRYDMSTGDLMVLNELAETLNVVALHGDKGSAMVEAVVHRDEEAVNMEHGER
mmetsp:Transcript_1260/g.3092  ORF Transcript_1260/g.3092 Transcript_1260/m.3092 type:complete len:251 (-) Transcript_1260:918-1670(-)